MWFQYFDLRGRVIFSPNARPNIPLDSNSKYLIYALLQLLSHHLAVRTGFERSAGRRQISSASSDLGGYASGSLPHPAKPQLPCNPDKGVLMVRKRVETP